MYQTKKHPKFDKSITTVRYCPCGREIEFNSGKSKYCIKHAKLSPYKRKELLSSILES